MQINRRKKIIAIIIMSHAETISKEVAPERECVGVVPVLININNIGC